jgi:hypothetical protein
MAEDKKRWQEPKVSSIDDLAMAFGATCIGGGSAAGCTTGATFSASPQACKAGSTANAKCGLGTSAAQQCNIGNSI